MHPNTYTRCFLLFLFTSWFVTSIASEHTVDVCVYGGTASGVMAAVTAAAEGKRVLLVEPSDHIGGMTGGGIGTIDYGKRSTIGGRSATYFNTYHKVGSEPSQPQLEVGLRALLSEQKVSVLLGHRLAQVQRTGQRIIKISVEYAPPELLGTPVATAKDEPLTHITARVFIDASYEGDLMAGAKVAYVTGRESAATYGEALAGRRAPAHIFPVDPYVTPGDPSSGLIPLVSADDQLALGSADSGVPACNFRLQLTKDPAARAPFPDFGDYDPAQYELLGRWIAVQVAQGKKPRLPFAIYHGKEFNENRDELVSLALIGGIRDYIDGDWATRARIWRAHERYTVGLFRFLATDERVPTALRTEAAAWGLRRDAFPQTNGWPHQLYIRQGRRMLGDYVVTQLDMDGSVRAADSIAIGSYKVDLYHTRRYACKDGVAIEGKVFTTLNDSSTGKIYKGDNNSSHPYGISYRAITPQATDCDNLLVPVCLSCSNVADSSIRMEPVYMILGEAAGHAALQTLAEDCAVQAITFTKLRERLLSAGQVLPDL